MRLARVMGAFLVPTGHVVTDEVTTLFYEQQLEPGNLDQFKSGPPGGVDGSSSSASKADGLTRSLRDWRS